MLFPHRTNEQAENSTRLQRVSSGISHVASTGISRVSSGISRASSGIINAATTGITRVTSKISQVSSGITNAATAGISRVSTGMSRLSSGITHAASSGISQASSKISKGYYHMTGGISRASSGISRVASNGASSISNGISRLVPHLNKSPASNKNPQISRKFHVLQNSKMANPRLSKRSSRSSHSTRLSRKFLLVKTLQPFENVINKLHVFTNICLMLCAFLTLLTSIILISDVHYLLNDVEKAKLIIKQYNIISNNDFISNAQDFLQKFYLPFFKDYLILMALFASLSLIVSFISILLLWKRTMWFFIIIYALACLCCFSILIFSIICAHLHSKIPKNIHEGFLELVKEYDKGNVTSLVVVSFTQVMFQCCGASSGHEYQQFQEQKHFSFEYSSSIESHYRPFPLSCCKFDSGNHDDNDCGLFPSPENSYEDYGCAIRVSREIMHNIKIPILLLLMTGLIMAFSVSLSTLVKFWLRDDENLSSSINQCEIDPSTPVLREKAATAAEGEAEK